jgi:hypothetical protein
MRVRHLALYALVVASPLAFSGCFLVAAGAGAAGAIAYTNRGASSNVSGNIDAVFDRSVTAFAAAGVRETGRSTEDSGAKRRLTGAKGEQEVIVELERDGDATTKVEVIARKNAVDYDKTLAEDVLHRIIAR